MHPRPRHLEPREQPLQRGLVRHQQPVPRHRERGVEAAHLEGDAEALRELYRLYGTLVFGVAYRVLGDRQLAEDLVAEAFTRAWTSWRTVREHPVPRAWVVRTALNTHVSWGRRRRREMTVDGRTALTLVDATQLGSSADPDLDEGLAAAVRALPARQREVITLRVFFDLDTDATAKLLGISAGTVGAHLHRALAALRTQIQSFSDQGVNR